jgi:hypothetical protein
LSDVLSEDQAISGSAKKSDRPSKLIRGKIITARTDQNGTVFRVDGPDDDFEGDLSDDLNDDLDDDLGDDGDDSSDDSNDDGEDD